MRIATGTIAHESSTFTPIPTTYESFSEGSALGIVRGQEILEAHRGTNREPAGYLDSAEEHGFELVGLLWTATQPSGPIEASAWSRLKGELVERLQAAMPVDGGLFDLHGAMVAEGVEDAEGDLLEAIREVMGPDRPIFVTLDLHCNITPQMVEKADVIIPCDNFPHTDLRERGREAADLIVRTLRGEIHPTMSWTQLPQLWVAGQFTGLEPFKSIIGRAHELEAQPGILTASVAPGFTWADIEHAGSSVIVIADGDQALADRESRALGEWVFAQREHFDAHMVSFDEALQAARARDSWPAVITDPQDNPGAGTPGDSTGMLRAFLQADLQNALLACVWDPEVAAAATAAGVGAELTVEVGGKSIATQGAPVPLTATVEHLWDGKFTIEGPMHAGAVEDYGPTAVLRQGGVHVAVMTERSQIYDLEPIRRMGFDPAALRWIGLKSINHFRAAFSRVSDSIHRVEFPSCQPHDARKLPFKRLRRPIWPLDEGAGL